MTDNEIIEALERCSKGGIESCKECPCDSHKCINIDLYGLALSLINRQKAEIEHHRKTIARNAQLAHDVTIDELQKARADAVKEFAERLHGKIDNFRKKREMVMLPYTESALLLIEKHIDNLVKEFTEGEWK